MSSSSRNGTHNFHNNVDSSDNNIFITEVIDQNQQMPHPGSNFSVVPLASSSLSLPPPNIPYPHTHLSNNNVDDVSSLSLPSINNSYSPLQFCNIINTDRDINNNDQIEGQDQGYNSNGRRRQMYRFDYSTHTFHKDRSRPKYKASRKVNSSTSSTEHDVFNQLYQYASHSLIHSRLADTYNGIPEWNYSLEVGQNPQRARMCGFGEKDRRPISPLPFVKLVITQGDKGPVNIEDVDTAFYVCQAVLYEYGTDKEATLVVHPASQASLKTSPSLVSATANLVGTPIAQARVLRDVDNKPGIWFIYRDLSVRTDGMFYLKFQLFYIGFRGKINTTDNQSRILATANSKPFTVYTAKKFPGMVEITPLTKAFIEQGSKIPSRRDLKRTRNS
ncbi:8723_t:CDS:2 [Entrophospora sp. SA101]|nr:8723_t:CDS:2 [Entrophospora sp. SA101]